MRYAKSKSNPLKRKSSVEQYRGYAITTTNGLQKFAPVTTDTVNGMPNCQNPERIRETGAILTRPREYLHYERPLFEMTCKNITPYVFSEDYSKTIRTCKDDGTIKMHPRHDNLAVFDDRGFLANQSTITRVMGQKYYDVDKVRYAKGRDDVI